MAILQISHVVKSITYRHLIHRFRVFRQSQQLSSIPSEAEGTQPIDHIHHQEILLITTGFTKKPIDGLKEHTDPAENWLLHGKG